MTWNNIVIEGFCFGENKCGKSVSTYCLGKGHCPFFGYAESNEREVSLYVPLHLIIMDKLTVLIEDIYWKIRWYLWDQWHGKEAEEFLESLSVVDCPEWDEHLNISAEKYETWKASQDSIKE